MSLVVLPRFAPAELDALDPSPPALILAATDGYANSYRDETNFRQVARDLWEMIREEGVEAIQANLKTWLDEASQQGSGDDISVGLIWRLVDPP